MSQIDSPQPLKGMARAIELRQKDRHTLSAWEKFELENMLPDPADPSEDGSGLAQSLFKFTGEDEGLRLDELMLILNDPIRAYLLENGYVREIHFTDEDGVNSRYSWGDMVGGWDQMFER